MSFSLDYSNCHKRRGRCAQTLAPRSANSKQHRSAPIVARSCAGLENEVRGFESAPTPAYGKFSSLRYESASFTESNIIREGRTKSVQPSKIPCRSYSHSYSQKMSKALAACTCCGADISPRAYDCPNCGEAIRERPRPSVFIIVVKVVVSLAVLWAVFEIGKAVVSEYEKQERVKNLAALARESARLKAAQAIYETNGSNEPVAQDYREAQSNRTFAVLQQEKADADARIAAALEKKRQAFETAKTKAEAGVSFYQLKVGEMYLDGIGVETNLDEADRWLHKALSNGDFAATNAIARLRLREQSAR
jgi:transcription termination factor NusB